MKDHQAHLESLRQQAAEAALISDLTTVPQKRALFAKLAAHFNMLADEVERALHDHASAKRMTPCRQPVRLTSKLD
jgi:hypothetical protein